MNRGMKHSLFQKLGLFLSIELFLSFACLSQNLKKVDSINDKLNLPQSFSSQINYYLNLAETFSSRNLDSALKYGNKGLEEAIAANNDSLTGEFFEILGKIYGRKGRIDSAKVYFLKELSIAEKLKDNNKVAQAYYNLGLAARRVGDFDEAHINYLRGIEVIQDTPISITLGNLHSGLGSLFVALGDSSQAIRSYFKALQVRKSLSDSVGMGNTYINLGNFYRRFDMQDLAISMYDSALTIFERKAYMVGKIKVKKSIGNILSEAGKHNQALQIYEEILKDVDLIPDSIFSASVYNNIGATYILLGKNSNAKESFLKGFNLIKAKRNLELVTILQQNLIEAYKNEGNYQAALELTESFMETQDSLIQDLSEGIEEALESQYASKEENLQLIYEQKQLELTNRYLIIGIAIGCIGLLIGICLIFVRIRIRRRQYAFENRIARLIQDQDQAVFGAMIRGQERAYTQIAKELHDNIGMLLSATNLHFSNLEDKLDSQLESYQQAKSTLLKAVKEVRSLSRDILSDPLNYAGLVKALKDLLEVVRNSSQYQVVYETYGLEQSEIPPSVTHTIYRCIQELVSNVIKHAHATGISLVLSVEDDVLQAVFRDNGVGFNVQEQLKTQGIGLGNLSERMEEVNGTCTITSEIGKGTEVRLTVPLPASKSEWLAEQSQKQ